MDIGYYINRVNTPLENIDWVGLKTKGITEVYIRCAEENLEAISSHLSKIIAAGLKPYAWTWQGFTMHKEAIDKGWNICHDIEVYNILDYLFELKYIRCITKSAGKTFILCTKAQDWDGDQKWSVLKDYCDYLQPMLYLGDYGKTIPQLVEYMKAYNTLYPGKIYPALETYVSDKNVVAKTKVVLDSEIAAVKPYCKGVSLFRYGIDNFNNTPIVSVTPKPVVTILNIDKTVQQKLKDLGYYTGKVDGLQGTYTTEAIKTFQKDNGLKEDGIVGPITKATLFPTYSNVMIETNGVSLYRQTTGYTCGPSSLKMAISRYGYNYGEMTLASYAGTNSSGSSHSGLIRAAKRVNSSLTLLDKTFSSIGWAGVYSYIKNNNPIIAHIESFLNPGRSGHYVVICGINMITKQVKLCDPSYGIRYVSFAIMEYKMNWIIKTGRSTTTLMPLVKS